jgi:hypothetical protein
MKIQRIGYGRTAIPCEFMASQPCGETLYKEALIEDWEDEAESLKILREQVNSELGIQEDVKYLREQKQVLLAELKVLDGLVADARNQWAKIQDFQKKLGIYSEDPIPF